jgi:hypothetical protein
MAELIIDLKANTGQATAAVNELNEGIKDVGKSTEKVNTDQKQLEATLKQQENTIKVIDGAVNLLGGSVELLAGSLVLSGAASKEQAEEFEKAALGAIAFADGAKRTVDGIKNLNEGLAASGGIIGTVTKSFNALKVAIVSNPFTAVAVAIGAVVTALLIYNETTKESTEDTEEYQKSIDDLNSSLKQTQSIAGANANSIGALSVAFKEGRITQAQYVAQLKELGIDLDGVNLSTAKNIKLVNDLAQANNNITSQQAIRAKLEGELKLALDKGTEAGDRAVKNIKEQIAELDINTSRYTANRDAILGTLEAQKKTNEESPKTVERVKQETIEILNYKDAVDKRNAAIKEGIELFIKDALKGAEISPPPPILPQLPPDPLPALEKSALSFSDYLQKLNNDLNEFFSSNAGKAVGASLSTAANLAKTLAESQDESSEKAFNASKKYKIAAVVTSAIQSSFEAFGAAQQFGPILGPILGLAQVAAITIASNKAIADIKSSQFSAPGSVSTPSSGGASGAAALAINPAFGAGGFLGQPQGTITPVTTPAPPLRAYVVSADVTNGQQANAQITRRRTLGPG